MAQPVGLARVAPRGVVELSIDIRGTPYAIRGEREWRAWSEQDDVDYETGYTIYQWDESSGEWVVVDTVSANDTDYSVTGLSPGGTGYWFAVAPSNSTGNAAMAYFDYVETHNASPTVATPAAAGADPVSGTSTALSVFGADDGGEENLIYSWSILDEPEDYSAWFNVNDCNDAREGVRNRFREQ